MPTHDIYFLYNTKGSAKYCFSFLEEENATIQPLLFDFRDSILKYPRALHSRHFIIP